MIMLYLILIVKD